MVVPITVTLIDPDQVRSVVTISADARVRDVATSRCDLFWRTIKKNGTAVLFTASVRDGDVVAVESERIDQS